MIYKTKTIEGATVIIRENADGSVTSFGQNTENRDYVEYLEWVNEGNTPDAAD